MRRTSDAGQSLVIVAVSVVVLFGFLGLGLDLGYLRYMKRLVQRNADAAAIAAAAELPQCGAGSSACQTAMSTAAQSALAENGFPGATVATQTCTPSSTGLAVVINNPPICVSTDPHLNDTDYVEVLVSQQTPLNFATVFGWSTVGVASRSEAGMTSNLVYALNQTKSGAINVSDVSVQVMGGVVDESDSSSAFECYSGTTFTAPYIGVVGGSGTGRHFFRFGSCSYPQATPQADIAMPEYGSPPNPDPLYSQQASLAAQAPNPSSCGMGSGTTYTGSSTQITLSGATYTLNPGTYCGGIVISQKVSGHSYTPTVVTFNPGIYTLSSNGGSTGGLVIDAGVQVTGNEVGFYNYGPNGQINMTCHAWCNGTGYYQTSAITLTAPDGNCSNCSGSPNWQGILFYQPPNNTSSANVAGNDSYNLTIVGTSYFPSALVNYAIYNSIWRQNPSAASYNLLVANAIQLGCANSIAGYNFPCWNTWFWHNFWNLRHHRSPLQGTGGVGVVE